MLHPKFRRFLTCSAGCLLLGLAPAHAARDLQQRNGHSLDAQPLAEAALNAEFLGLAAAMLGELRTQFPHGVWISEFTLRRADDGSKTLAIAGSGLTLGSVSELLENLRGCPYLDEITYMAPAGAVESGLARVFRFRILARIARLPGSVPGGLPGLDVAASAALPGLRLTELELLEADARKAQGLHFCLRGVARGTAPVAALLRALHLRGRTEARVELLPESEGPPGQLRFEAAWVTGSGNLTGRAS